LWGGGCGVDVAGVSVPTIGVKSDEVKSTTYVQFSALKLSCVVKALKPSWEPNAGKGGNVEGGDDGDHGRCHCVV
jgi:hypothetical protein